jgi:excisionase family DNA binding protein
VKKNTTSSEERIALRTPDAARAIGVSVRQLQRLIASRELPSLRIGKIRLIRRAALEKFVAGLENAAE